MPRLLLPIRCQLIPFFGSPVKSSGVSRYDRQDSVIVMNKVPNSPDVIFYSF